MNKQRMQKVLVKGLLVLVLAAIAALSLARAESAHAAAETIRVGQSISGWIPTGDEIRWYQFEASPGTMVHITMTRKQRDLVPYLALRFHDGHDYQFVKVDHNEARSASAQISAVLPVSSNGYWIEAASVGTTAGSFTLSLSTDSMRSQGTGNDASLQSNGFEVRFTIDKIVCHNAQDGDGLDELELEYWIEQRAPYGAAVDDTKNKVDDMWMQDGWVFANFLPLTRRVGQQDSVNFWIKLVEEDSGWNDDEILAKDFNNFTAAELDAAARSGKPAPYYWPVGNGEYQYDIYYSVTVDYIYGLNIN